MQSEEINLLPKHSVTWRKLVFPLSYKQILYIYFFLVRQFSLVSEDIIVTNKLLTRPVIYFKVRLMSGFQGHVPMG